MTSYVLCFNLIKLDHSNDYAQLKMKGCISINNATKLRQLNNDDITYLRTLMCLYICHASTNKTNPNAINLVIKHVSSSEWNQTPLRSRMKKSHLCKTFHKRGTAFTKGETHYIKVPVN